MALGFASVIISIRHSTKK